MPVTSAVGRRLILLRGPPDIDRTFALTGHTDDVEIADVAPGGPPIQALPGKAPTRGVH